MGRRNVLAAAAVIASLLPVIALASSHREAPCITTRSKVDVSELNLFDSDEVSRAGYVALIASYQPFENPQGGPNYYPMDPSAAMQNDSDMLEGDFFGFPNRGRPIDDGVDIELRVAMGVLLTPFDGTAKDPALDAPRQLDYTDGTEPIPANYLPAFPYLNTVLAGSRTRAND